MQEINGQTLGYEGILLKQGQYIIMKHTTTTFFYFILDFFKLRRRFPSLHGDFLHHSTMILQCIIEGNTGFEPGTSAPEVRCTSNECLLNYAKYLISYRQKYLRDVQVDQIFGCDAKQGKKVAHCRAALLADDLQ